MSDTFKLETHVEDVSVNVVHLGVFHREEVPSYEQGLL